MLNIRKILLPVDFPLSTLTVLHQAATLAQHFHSEILLLHVVTPRSHAAGVPDDSRGMAAWDLRAAIARQAQELRDPSLETELQGLAVRAKLAKGDVATAVTQMAQDEGVDLIMMATYSFAFSEFLLGSVTVKVLHGTECPVWTGAHREDSPGGKLVIRHILGAVEFGPRAEITVQWAAQMAAEFGARLSLANVTAGVEIWGPGGTHVDPWMKKQLVSSASQQMVKLQQDMGTKADVFIGSGDVSKVLSQLVKQTEADLLVTGSYPYGGHLRTHGFGIIRAVQIPVLNV